VINLVSSQVSVETVWNAQQHITPQAGPDAMGLVPAGARGWLAALRLLSGVAFQHLVPDTRLLPPESARFFYIDRAWTDALIQGALSVGVITDADRGVLEQIYPFIRADLDEAERTVRVIGSDGPETGSADVLTGLLLRSEAVRGWPGLHVHAYREAQVPDNAQDDPSRLHVMRMELLATSVLLVILDGIPAVVHIDEPRHGVQFGVDENSTSAVGTWAYELTLRPNAATGDLSDGNAPPVAVPFRPNAPGVIDISSLQTTIGANSPSSLALQLIRLPYRQVFGPTPPPSPLPTPSEMFATAFEPSVTISEIRSWPDYATNVSSEGAP
jgi:hypothetical protein